MNPRLTCLVVLLLARSPRPCTCVQHEGPCEYEPVSIAASDPTPWGGTAAEEFGQLSNPYIGTWTWGSSTEELEIPASGESFPAEAKLDIDESSYRILEYVGGGGEIIACFDRRYQVDGELSFRAVEGEVFVSIPVTVERVATETGFKGKLFISPITAFSEGLIELTDIEDAKLRGLLNWGLAGEFFRANFDYVGQTIDSVDGKVVQGSGFIVGVGDFESE